MNSQSEPQVPEVGPSARQATPPSARGRAAMSLTMSAGLVSVAALAAMGLDLPVQGLRQTLFLAISILVLASALEFCLRRGWGEPARIALLFFLAGATLGSLHLWPNPSEISPEGGPGWLGLWLVAVPIVLSLPPWAGAVGIGVAWVSVLCRGALVGATPDLEALTLASISLVICAITLASFRLNPLDAPSGDH